MIRNYSETIECGICVQQVHICFEDLQEAEQVLFMFQFRGKMQAPDCREIREKCRRIFGMGFAADLIVRLENEALVCYRVEIQNHFTEN